MSHSGCNSLEPFSKDQHIYMLYPEIESHTIAFINCKPFANLYAMDPLPAAAWLFPVSLQAPGVPCGLCLGKAIA